MKKTLIILVILLAMAGVVSAVDVGDYQIEYIGYENNADDTTTFTYSIAGLDNGQQDLSHFWMRLCTESAENYVAPTDGPYSNDGVSWTVDTKHEGQATELKLENPNPVIANGDSAEFQFTVKQGWEWGSVDVGAKYGQSTPGGTVDGPNFCNTTAVSLSSIHATGGNDGSFHAGTFVVMLVLLLITVVVLYRRMEKRS